VAEDPIGEKLEVRHVVQRILCITLHLVHNGVTLPGNS